NDVLSAAGVQSVFLTRCQFTDIEIVDTQHGIVDGNVAQGHVAGVLDGDGVGDGVTHLVFLLVRRLGDLYGGIVIDIDGPIGFVLNGAFLCLGSYGGRIGQGAWQVRFLDDVLGQGGMYRIRFTLPQLVEFLVEAQH